MLILLTAAAVLLLIIIYLSVFTYRMTFYWPKRLHPSPDTLLPGKQYDLYKDETVAMMEELAGCSFEEVTITAKDGVKLFGRYYHVADGAPVQLQMHGYHGSYLRDFCGASKLAREMGQNALIIDQRSHGNSGSSTVTFGIKERLDCLCWIEYLVERFGSETPIFLSGVSMGAATVLMASELELPRNVIGIVADCPYSSPGAIIRKVAKGRGFPPKLSYPFIKLGALLWGGFDLDEASAAEAVKHTKVPILLIHGEEDHLCPCSMSREIAENGGEMVQLETFPEADHGLSFMLDLPRYRRLCKTFMEKQLKAFEPERFC